MSFFEVELCEGVKLLLLKEIEQEICGHDLKHLSEIDASSLDQVLE